MKRIINAARWTGILLGAALLTGCVSSTVVSRTKERHAAYEALSPEARTLVDQGQIKIGMSTDAVYIAWGAPAQVTEGETEKGRTSTWTYLGSYLQDVQTFGWRRTYTSSYIVNYVRAKVVFAEGVVKEWQTYPAPGY